MAMGGCGKVRCKLKILLDGKVKNNLKKHLEMKSYRNYIQ